MAEAGTDSNFKCLGAVVSDDGSKLDFFQAGALTKPKLIWRDKNITPRAKVKLMLSLVISIFLYTCESWTLAAELVFEMRVY